LFCHAAAVVSIRRTAKPSGGNGLNAEKNSFACNPATFVPAAACGAAKDWPCE
jgi:hypothetical protein